jgi:hypothetical protein
MMSLGFCPSAEQCYCLLSCSCDTQDLAAAYGGKSAKALTDAVSKHQAEFSQVQTLKC